MSQATLTDYLFLNQDPTAEVDRGELRSAVTTDFDSFHELGDLTVSLLNIVRSDVYQETPANSNKYSHYRLLKAETSGRTDYLRPINTEMFVADPEAFSAAFDEFVEVIEAIPESRDRVRSAHPAFFEANTFNQVLYTIAQSIGMGLELLAGTQASRKNFGQRFESIIHTLLDEIGLANKELTLTLEIDENDSYSCQIDGVISPFEHVRTTDSMIDSEEVILSIKTTSKDRMPKIFADKLLLNKFTDDGEVRLTSLFLHDVQRKGDRVQTTFVANNFYIYHTHLTPLQGTYFVDPPAKASAKGFRELISTFEEFYVDDVWQLVD